MSSNSPSMGLFQASFIFVLVAGFLFYEMGVQVSTSIMTTQLIKDLRLDAFLLGILSGAFFFTYTLFQIPAGLLFDRFHVRTVLMIPLLLCSVGCYTFANSNTILFGAFGRMLMGAGSAFAFIAVLVVVTDVFPAKWFALLTGVTQMLAALGAISGEAPLVPLVKAIGWRSTMSVLAIGGFLLATLIWFFVRYQSNKPQTNRDNRMSIVQSMKEICSNCQTWMIALYACLLWAPMAAFASLWGVPYLKTAFLLTDMSAASLLLMMWLGIAFGAPIIGWWSDFIEKRRVPLMFCALLGATSFSLIIFYPKMPIILLAVLLFAVGVSCSGQALSFALVRDINLRENIAAAIGVNNMAVVIAGAIFQPLVGKLINISWDHTTLNGTPVYTFADYQFGLYAIVAGYVVSVITSYFIRDAKS